MHELYVLHYVWTFMRARLSAVHDDDRGVTTLEAVLWIAGLGVLAITTLVIITARVNKATNNIPTGPSIP